MKKREKFLIAFLISFVIVMSIFLIWKTKTARYYSLRAKEEYDWLYKSDDLSYESLTEEAKQTFEEVLKLEEENEKEYIQYCSEHPEECTPDREHQGEIMSQAMEYYKGSVNQYMVLADSWYNESYLVLEVITYILLLTLIIYSIITIEFKNKKQYFVDNIKLLLIIIIFYSIADILALLLGYIIDYDRVSIIEYTASQMLENAYYSIVGLIMISILTWGIIYVPNLIIILIKNRKLKNAKKQNSN